MVIPLTNLTGAKSNNSANTREHNLRVCEICITLLEMGIPFAKQTKQVFAPTLSHDHIKPIMKCFGHKPTKISSL